MVKKNMIKKKTLLISILSILIIISLLTTMLPYFLSTSPGKGLVVKLIHKKGYENFSAEELSLKWMGPQKIEGLKLQTDSFDITAKTFETDLNLLELLTTSRKNILTKKIRIDLKDASIEVTHPDIAPASLTDINGSINFYGKNKKIILKLTGNSEDNGKTGNFDLSTSIDNNAYIGDINLKNFPTDAIDELLVFYLKISRGTITEILGPKTDLHSSFKIIDSNGPIDIDLSSTNAKASIKANYNDNAITLNESVNISLNLTEKLSKYLLNDINPLLIYGIHAYFKIQITISNDGFYLPINPFKLNDLRIDNSMIDLGKIRTKNGSNLSLIIGIMKFRSLLDVDEMNIWCTPVYIKIKDGTAYTSRMDAILADALHICTWGHINLNTKKVNMTLGLTAQALKQGFGISNMPSSYVMQVPMKGTTNKLKIDKSAAAAKIAALLALQSTDSSSIFGQILGAFKHIGDDQSDIPPPIRPFPWER